MQSLFHRVHIAFLRLADHFGHSLGIQCALSGLLVDWLVRVKEEIMNESNKDQQY